MYVSAQRECPRSLPYPLHQAVHSPVKSSRRARGTRLAPHASTCPNPSTDMMPSTSLGGPPLIAIPQSSVHQTLAHCQNVPVNCSQMAGPRDHASNIDFVQCQFSRWSMSTKQVTSFKTFDSTTMPAVSILINHFIGACTASFFT